MKYKNFIFLTSIVAIFIIFAPNAYASSVFLNTNSKSITQGDTFIVNLRLVDLDKKINAVDGIITFDKDLLEAKTVSVGGSSFTMWAEKPQISNEDGKINFVGGSPDGFSGDGSVFKIIFFAKKVGDASVKINDNFALFLDDGNGTVIRPKQNHLSVSILKRMGNTNPSNEWEKIIEGDRVSPEPFKTILSKNMGMFNNRYFVSFFAIDKESGVDHYEIKEGNNEYVIADSPYVLLNQELSVSIEVKAIDFAGNEHIEKFVPTPTPTPTPTSTTTPGTQKINYLYAIGIILIVIILYLFGRKIILKNKKG